MHPRARHGLLALALVAALALGTTPATASSGTPGSRTHSSPAAARALEHAHALFSPRSVAARRAASSGAPKARPEATVVLLQLFRHLGEMSPADRRTARGYLARPTDNSTSNDVDPMTYEDPTQVRAMCSAHFCLHWVPTGADAPDPTDTNANLVPDAVEHTDAVMEQVWRKEVVAAPGEQAAAGNLGYRAPRADAVGADPMYDGSAMPAEDLPKLDVYLLDTGAQQLYGYCAPDGDSPSRGTSYAAYCALDNDFDPSQFGGASVDASLKPTAAHEFFHAVQFNYDAGEDIWFMESTAAWMETQVFPSIHDNRQFLSTGPLGHPGIPLDFFDPDPTDKSYYPQYGAWIFWQLAGETFGPGIVKDVWTRAQRSGQYSLTALKGALAARHTTLATFFARFGAINHYPGRAYRNGSLYRPAPLAGDTFMMTPQHLSQGPVRRVLDHLTNKTVRFRAGSTLTGRRQLRLTFDMASSYRLPAATVVVHFADGTVRRHPVALDRTGAGHLRVPFSRSRVSFVEVTLSNASSRYRCNQGVSVLSCGGVPLDDSVKAVVSAKVLAG